MVSLVYAMLLSAHPTHLLLRLERTMRKRIYPTLQLHILTFQIYVHIMQPPSFPLVLLQSHPEEVLLVYQGIDSSVVLEDRRLVVCSFLVEEG